jgi:hypothetical protein
MPRSLHPNTAKAFKWILASILITASVIGFCRLATFLNLNGTVFGANVLNAPEFLVTTVKQSSTISYGTQSEIYRFSVNASTAYTLRYLTASIKADGLKIPSNPALFKVYEVRGDKIDFSRTVGYGEKIEGNEIRLRFFSDESDGSYGFLGVKGKTIFAILSSVLKDTSSTAQKSLQVCLVPGSSKLLNWAFIFGHDNRAWMDIENALGAGSVSGLSTEMATRL